MKALNRIVFPRFSRKDIGMRSIVIALVCTLMPTVALSTEYVATDGVWWSSAGNAEKITLIQGMIAGLEEGWSSGADAVWYFSRVATARKHTRID